jgi:hypothetical protein
VRIQCAQAKKINGPIYYPMQINDVSTFQKLMVENASPYDANAKLVD